MLRHFFCFFHDVITVVVVVNVRVLLLFNDVVAGVQGGYATLVRGFKVGGGRWLDWVLGLGRYLLNNR